jgi:predicted O-linked N-acetylglucosamine transferase (SPINDLY family)
LFGKLSGLFGRGGAATGAADTALARGQRLLGERQFAQAEGEFAKVLEAAPQDAAAYLGLAESFWGRNRFKEAGGCYMRAHELAPKDGAALVGLADTLFQIGKHDEALAEYRKAIALDADAARRMRHRSHYGDVLANQVIANRSVCDWQGLAAKEAELLQAVRERGACLSPIILLFMDCTPADLLLCARHQMESLDLPHTALPVAAPHRDGKIRLAYAAGTFFKHATSYLVAELFERHDRTRFEVFAYSFGIDDGSDWRARIQKGVDHFIDMRTATPFEVAQRINRDGIDILVDLMGLMQPFAFPILAHRPAPVQVNFLGFPGTMGADFVDYIIADRYIAPLDVQDAYAERIVQLPDCYQSNDRTKAIAADTPSRADCGLPKDGFVFCSFNASVKLSPEFFAIWMRLLKAVPGSVLWLIEPGSKAQVQAVAKNLRREASKLGVDPKRLVFAPRVPMTEHLARHRCADLFLDSLPCGAHTTMSDALWAGLPALACMGPTFAGRVGGSILHAMGLEELVVETPEAYEALALALATDPARLAGLRERLAQNRLTAPLFDTPRFAKGIEAAYIRMHEIRCAGQPPAPIVVTPDMIATSQSESTSAR